MTPNMIQKLNINKQPKKMQTTPKILDKGGKPPILNHFVKFNYLFGILKNREIALTDPSKWEDKNDIFLIEKYKQEKRIKSLFAICFLRAPETYHHWKIYAGECGACIEFDKRKMVNLFKADKFCEIKKVRYWSATTINDKIKTHEIDIELLPYIKRPPYRGEEEIRGIFIKNEKFKEKIYKLKFQTDCINKITISPWVSDAAYNEIKKSIIGYGYDGKIINHSKLLNADFWQNSFDLLFRSNMKTSPK